MRWICSCGHGTSGDAVLFLHATADGIPLLRDPLMEGLLEAIGTDPAGAIRSVPNGPASIRDGSRTFFINHNGVTDAR